MNGFHGAERYLFPWWVEDPREGKGHLNWCNFGKLFNLSIGVIFSKSS